VVVKPVKDAQNIFMPTPDAKNAVNVDQTKVCQSSNIYFKRPKASSHLTLLSFVNTIPMKVVNGHFAEAALERMVQTAS